MVIGVPVAMRWAPSDTVDVVEPFEPDDDVDEHAVIDTATSATQPIGTILCRSLFKAPRIMLLVPPAFRQPTL